MRDKSIVSYAQNREDVILNAFFDDNEVGFYVDVGANHPVHESVTKLFYDKNWRGMNIEPTSRLFELLDLTRPRDVNVQVGVSDKSASLQFREYVNGDGLSTFSGEMQASYEKDDYHFTREYKEYQVEVTTLAKLFARYKVTKIDFMKVDVEGYEYEALAGNDWKKYRPRVLCIEANHVMHDWHPMIKQAGYRLIFFDGLNEYFVAEEASDIIERFSYPDKVLLGTAYITRKEFLARQDADRQIKDLRRQLTLKSSPTEDSTDATPNSRDRSARNIKTTLKHVNGVIESRLTSVKVAVPTDASQQIDTAESLVAELQRQIVETTPVTGQLKSATHRGYRSAKQTLKKTIKGKIR